MGSRLAGDDDDVISDINVTPFVDIVLVLLIIFMVTATSIVKSTIKVDLPDAASGEATEAISLGLTLKEDGSLLLDGEPVSTDELELVLREAKESDEEVVCLIAADKTVAHGRVVWLIDLVKSQGIAKFAININKTDVIGPDPASQGLGSAPVEVQVP